MSSTWTIESASWASLTAGETFSVRMVLGFTTSPNLVSATLDGTDVCEGDLLKYTKSICMIMILFAACEDGWSGDTSSTLCYQYVSSSELWEDAQDYCQNLGGELASVTSSDINDFLTTLTEDPAWVGGYKNDGNWNWSDGSTFDYTNWASTPTQQPDNAGGDQDKIQINWRSSQIGVGYWDDLETDHYASGLPFICQK